METLLANLQYAIGVIASLVMVALKKIPFIEAQKQWLIPLLMIAACVIACGINHIPNWFMAGTTMALAICKIYDWINADK